MYKVGDKVRIKTNLTEYESDRCAVTNAMVGMEGQVHIIEEISLINHNYKIFTNSGDDYWWFSEEMLEPTTPTLEEVALKGLTCVIHTPSKEDAKRVVGKILSSKSYTTGDEWLEYWDTYKENTCYNIIDGRIDAYGRKAYFEAEIEQGGNYLIYEFSDLFAIDGIATLKSRDESVSFASAPYLDLSLILPTNSRELEEKFNKELANHFNAFPNDGISAKNGGKNSMKFTFYTIEGYRMDKSNNTKIPTVTTEVVYKDKDGCATGGSATCDKADYDERQGVLEAIANSVLGNFDCEYNKAVKDNARADKISRTCKYCGKVFDTVEEKQAHEAWHIERKKARRERYLLRKRAKEIAFEEQAQKMAKEMIEEDK